jgi:hypothetical protein
MPVVSKTVFSSFVSDLEWDAETQTLTVGYKNGGTSSHRLDEDTAMAIWDAPSIGKALHDLVPGFTSKGPRK